MNPIEHAQFVSRVMSAHKITDVMVSALLTGKNEDGSDNVIQAGPKQIKALVERGFVSEEYHYLTEKGQLVYRALSGSELTEDETNELLQSTVTTSGRSAGTFVIDVTVRTVTEMIRPSENGEGLPWADAKQAIRDHFLAEREFARTVLQNLPKLRKAEVTEAQNKGSDAEESDSDAEALFSDESETVDA